MNYAKRIIDRMGGPTKAARLIGKPTSTVKSWCEAGSIPDRHKASVWRAAAGADLWFTYSEFLPDDLTGRIG